MQQHLPVKPFTVPLHIIVCISLHVVFNTKDHEKKRLILGRSYLFTLYRALHMRSVSFSQHVPSDSACVAACARTFRRL